MKEEDTDHKYLRVWLSRPVRKKIPVLFVRDLTMMTVRWQCNDWATNVWKQVNFFCMIINKKVRFKPWWLRWVLFGRNLFLITPRIMVTTNLTGDGTQTFIELLCSPSLVGKLQLQLISFLAAVNILLSITAFLGNSLILVALHKESSLHPPSKLFSRRCPATTDMLVALVTQPLHATHWMSVVYRH